MAYVAIPVLSDTLLTRPLAVYYSEEVANRVRTSISQPGHPHGYALARNPLDIPWFTVQVHMCVTDFDILRTLNLNVI